MESELMQAIVTHLDQYKLKYRLTSMEELPVIQLVFRDGPFSFDTTIFVREDRGDTVQVYMRAPVSAPVDKRLAMAEYVARANLGLILGNFEFSMDDGDLRYKNSVCTGGQPFHPEMLTPLIGASLSTIGRYMPGVIAVMYEWAKPADAIESVEGDGAAARLRDMLDEDVN